MNWARGKEFERQAEKFLIAKSYLVLERNWHAGRYGELDLICFKKNTLVFVEVRGRNSLKAHDDALLSIDKNKAKKLFKTIQAYLQKVESEKLINFENTSFDLITVSESGLKHFQNIPLIDYIG